MSIQLLMFFLILFLLVLIIGACELMYNTTYHSCSGKIPSKCAIVKHSKYKHPVYIINTDVLDLSKINLPNYDVRDMSEHIVGKVYYTLNNYAKNIRRDYKTKTPVNTAYNILGKSDDIFNTINPISSSKLHKYRLLAHLSDKVEGFIYNGKYYLI
jgi:hypothetical protein